MNEFFRILSKTVSEYGVGKKAHRQSQAIHKVLEHAREGFRVGPFVYGATIELDSRIRKGRIFDRKKILQVGKAIQKIGQSRESRARASAGI